MKIVYISVVRDFDMYRRCVSCNPHCAGGIFAVIDNRARNEPIGVGYNRILASRPANENDAWYVFCHEDFELREPLAPRLEKLDTAALWGPIGAATEVRFGVYHRWGLRGSVLECAKNGENAHLIGSPVPEGTHTETFDCQCLIVHSSLVRAQELRFDENLTFDLYVEDFCIAAHERALIPSRILPLAACHWSGGDVQPRYYAQEAYLAKKWKSCCYTGVGSWILGGRPSLGRRLTVGLKRLLRR